MHLQVLLVCRHRYPRGWREGAGSQEEGGRRDKVPGRVGSQLRACGGNATRQASGKGIGKGCSRRGIQGMFKVIQGEFKGNSSAKQGIQIKASAAEYAIYYTGAHGRWTRVPFL